MMLYVFLIGREVIWFCCGMWCFHIRKALAAFFFFWGWLFNVLCEKFCYDNEIWIRKGGLWNVSSLWKIMPYFVYVFIYIFYINILYIYINIYILICLTINVWCYCRKKEAINTVISWWVGKSMKTKDSGLSGAGAECCVDEGGTVVVRSPFFSHCMSYNHPCSYQQWQMSRSSDMEGFAYTACQAWGSPLP